MGSECVWQYISNTSITNIYWKSLTSYNGRVYLLQLGCSMLSPLSCSGLVFCPRGFLSQLRLRLCSDQSLMCSDRQHKLVRIGSQFRGPMTAQLAALVGRRGGGLMSQNLIRIYGRASDDFSMHESCTCASQTTSACTIQFAQRAQAICASLIGSHSRSVSPHV